MTLIHNTAKTDKKMKRIKLYALLVAVASLGLYSCIDETVPNSSTVTSEQLAASTSGLEALASGIPAQLTQGYLVYGSQVHETDLAFPQYMLAQTNMLGDMYPCSANSGYDWFYNYSTYASTYGETSYMAYLPWFTLYQFIKSANDIIGTIDFDDTENLTSTAQAIGGAAYACRAFYYYTLMYLFEPVRNIYTDCSDVLYTNDDGEEWGYTVVLVTDETTAEEAANNPRVKHDSLVAFIHSDLDKAEVALADGDAGTGLPNLAATYAIRAKVYLWDKEYAKAAEYAQKAIDEAGVEPMTEEEWTDPTTAFAYACDSWIWYASYAAENMGNLCNYTGWASPESDWGYASLTQPQIDASLYNHIQDTDFRKHVFIDGTGSSYYKYETCRDQDFLDGLEPYTALKIRCKDGNYSDYSVGGAVDIPIIRIEEMYLIRAEALTLSEGAEAGRAALNSFVQTYRDPSYNCTLTTKREVLEEIIWQERIEFWAEGTAFPSAKRAKTGCMQYYTGTNAPSNPYHRNCKGIKPNWILCIPIYEIQNNPALEDWNNPDPTNCTDYTTTPLDEYSEGNGYEDGPYEGED